MRSVPLLLEVSLLSLPTRCFRQLKLLRGATNKEETTTRSFLMGVLKKKKKKKDRKERKKERKTI